MRRFPRLYAAASLKPKSSEACAKAAGRFPRLYAAASLKPDYIDHNRSYGLTFSAALCRGLIEAGTC